MINYLKAYIYNSEERYVSILLEDSIDNICSFIANTPFDGKVIICTLDDTFILSTIGNYLDRIDIDYRNEIIETLIEHQTNEKRINPIIFKIDNIHFDNTSKSERNKLMDYIYEVTSYDLRCGILEEKEPLY